MMVGFTNPLKKKHNALDQDQIDAHISDLEKSFDSLWNPEVDTLYRSLIQTMGTDFTYPKALTDEYIADVVRFAEQVKLVGFADKEKKLSVYETPQGHIYANQNRVEFAGQTFDAAAADTMAFLAVHDKDMMKKGVTLDGNDVYQKALLQLSIQHHNPNIKIHNQIDPSKLNVADQKLVEKALTDFNAHQASKNNPAPKQNVGINAGGDNQKTVEEPNFSLSDDQYNAVKADVIDAGKGSKSVISASLARNGVNATNMKAGIDDARTRLAQEDFIEVKPQGNGHTLKVIQDITAQAVSKAAEKDFSQDTNVSATFTELPFADYGKNTVSPLADGEYGKAFNSATARSEPLILKPEQRVDNKESLILTPEQRVDNKTNSSTDARFLTEGEVALAQKLVGDFVKSSNAATSTAALETGFTPPKQTGTGSSPNTPAA